MKNSSNIPAENDDMRTEYDFSDSKPNKYAEILKQQERIIQLDPDLYKIFDTSEKVNNALRNLLKAIPI